MWAAGFPVTRRWRVMGDIDTAEVCLNEHGTESSDCRRSERR